MKIAGFIALAVVICGVYVTTNATAASHPEFDTESGKTLLFTSTGGLATLFTEQAGIVGEIMCEKSSGHGEILNKTPLADNITISFTGKCHLTINGSSNNCTEPIGFQPVRGEIGLILPATSPKTVGILLIPYNAAGKWAEFNCDGLTEVSGAIIGTFPETSEYNKFDRTAEIKFTSKGTTQEPQEIDLLGVEMKGIHLVTKGAFGGNLGEHASGEIVGDGGINILTNK